MSGYLEGDFLKSALQFNVGYKRKYFELAYSAKPTKLFYSSINGDLIFEGVDQKMALEGKRYGLVEQAITLSAGSEKVKLEIQLGSVWNDDNSQFVNESKYVSLGLKVDFNLLAK